MSKEFYFTQLFCVISRTLVCDVFPSAEKQSVYSTAPSDWTIFYLTFLLKRMIFLHILFTSSSYIYIHKVWNNIIIKQDKTSKLSILKKAGGHIDRNVVEITIKMKIIIRKTLIIKINKLRVRNLDNY